MNVALPNKSPTAVNIWLRLKLPTGQGGYFFWFNFLGWKRSAVLAKRFEMSGFVNQGTTKRKTFFLNQPAQRLCIANGKGIRYSYL